MRHALLLLSGLALAGCGAAALPFRVVGDVIDIVPVIGSPISGALHGVGNAID
jgi:hypothetical protein